MIYRKNRVTKEKSFQKQMYTFIENVIADGVTFGNAVQHHQIFKKCEHCLLSYSIALITLSLSPPSQINVTMLTSMTREI